MSAWAYRCRPCVEGVPDWFVSQWDVEQLGPEVRIVRVRVGREWKCALLDRSQAVTVDDQLLRAVIASDEADCPECAELLAQASHPPISDDMQFDSLDGAENGSPGASSDGRRPGTQIEAAAVSLQGQPFVIVVCPATLLESPGEADMAIEDLQPYFGGVPIVLMARTDEGAIRYYGDRQLVDRLAGIPVDRMPWKEYTIG